MKYTKYLSKDQATEIDNEFISQDAKVYLSRLLNVNGEEPFTTAFRNIIINIARECSGLGNIILETDDGDYEVPVVAWHAAEFTAAIRRLNTVELLEFLGEILTKNVQERVDEKLLNEIFESENSAIRVKVKDGSDHTSVYYDIIPLTDLEKLARNTSHPNIRVLIDRMASGISSNDPSAVLHASSSIFETLAKDIVALPGVQDQTLAAFFARYRKDSGLPEPVLDYILNIYKQRNTTPLAGHGSTQSPAITGDQAIILAEVTKAFVNIEYKLKLKNISASI